MIPAMIHPFQGKRKVASHNNIESQNVVIYLEFGLQLSFVLSLTERALALASNFRLLVELFKHCVTSQSTIDNFPRA